MARTTRPTSDSYDFQVVQEPLFNRGGKAAVVGKSPVMGNFRTDTGQCLGTSTEAYAIVQNGDLVEQVEDALGKSELGEFTSQKLVARDGARFYGVYDFPSMVKPVVLGDGAGMRLTLNNSFDRSTGVDFTLGLMRLICLNGQMTLVADTSVTKKHSHKLTLDFITDAIHSCTLKFEESIKDFGTLAEREIAIRAVTGTGQDAGRTFLLRISRANPSFQRDGTRTTHHGRQASGRLVGLD